MRVNIQQGWEPTYQELRFVDRYEAIPMNQTCRPMVCTIELAELSRAEGIEVIRRLQGMRGIPAVEVATDQIESTLAPAFPRRLDIA